MKNQTLGSYIKPTEDTVWPNPEDPKGIEWVLRHGCPTESERMVAASFINAYKHLFSMTIKERNKRISEIKKILIQKKKENT